MVRDGRIVLTGETVAGLTPYNPALSAFSVTVGVDDRSGESDRERGGRFAEMSDTIILDTPALRQSAAVNAVFAGAHPVFAGFRIEQTLGKGAMSTVYLGRRTARPGVAAIKAVALAQKGLSGGAHEFGSRFLREVSTIRRLRHPGVVKIFGAGEAGGYAYLAMEYVPGGDLAQFVDPGSLLPLRKTLSMIAQVADALCHVHGRGVVHQDVKPANILCGKDGNSVKLTDFGISGLSGTMAGTPYYLSPEQVCGRPAESRSDLFSLGVTLYQMTCGRLPFAANSLPQLMFNIAYRAHYDIRTRNPALPRPLAAIIDRALAKQPQERYQSGGEMARALRSCISSLATAADDSAANRAQKGNSFC